MIKLLRSLYLILLFSLKEMTSLKIDCKIPRSLRDHCSLVPLFMDL